MFIGVYIRVLSVQIYARHKNKYSGTLRISPNASHRGIHGCSHQCGMSTFYGQNDAVADPPLSVAYTPTVGFAVQLSQPPAGHGRDQKAYPGLWYVAVQSMSYEAVPVVQIVQLRP